MPGGRGQLIRNTIGLVLYLAGGWRSYREIGEEFGWAIAQYSRCKTAFRNVRALEQVGIPVEWCMDTHPIRMRLSADWVARTLWLRRYVIVEQPLPRGRPPYITGVSCTTGNYKS